MTEILFARLDELTASAATLQPLSANLTALAALDATGGLLTQTGAASFVRRTLLGTAAQITVTNGDGVAGAPTISLPTALTFTGFTITGGTFNSPALVTPALGTPASGVATNLTGTAAGLIAGDVANAPVIAKVLTGYVSGAGTVAATDTILQAFQKLNGNDALALPKTGGTMSGAIAMGTNAITGLTTLAAAGALTFQSNGSTTGGVLTATQKWGFGGAAGALTPTNTNVVISNNAAVVDAATPGLVPVLQVVGADGALSSLIIDGFANQTGFGFRRANGTGASPTVMTVGVIGSFFGAGYDGSAGKYGYSGEIDFFASETWSATAHGGGIRFYSNPNGSATQANSMTLQQSGGLSIGTVTDGGIGSILANTAIKSQGATAGIGYAVGAGGSVTQPTSRTTGVTLNTVSGAITLFSQVNSAVSGATAQSFTVTNSAVSITDTIQVSQKSGTDKYLIFVTNVAAGSFQITNYTTGGVTNEAPVFTFNVLKGVIT